MSHQSGARITRRDCWRVAVACAAMMALTVPTLSAQPAPGALVQRTIRLNPRQPVSFDAAVSSTSVFVGEQITYEMGIFIAEEAMQRMRRNPEVVPAPLRGVLAFDLGTARTLPAIQQNGVRAVPHVLARALFPLTPGTLLIPASTMTYALPRSTSYFSRELSATLTTRPLQVTVKPLPERGRPATFTGAIGELSIRLALPSASARIGDPVTVVVSVSGRGNAKLWPRPVLRVDSGAAAPPVLSTERVRVDSSTRVIRGTHDFEWIVTPTRAGALELVVQPYVYFSPERASYETALVTAEQLTVLPQGSVAATGTESPRTVGAPEPSSYTVVDAAVPWWRRVARGPLIAALVVVCAGCAVCTVAWRRRRMRRPPRGLKTRSTREQLLAVLQRTQADSDTRIVRARLDAYLIDRFRPLVPALGAITQLEALLRQAGVSRPVVERLCAMRDQLDQAAWGPESRPLDEPLRLALLHAIEQLEQEALPREAIDNRSPVPAAGHGDAPLSRSSSPRLIP